MRHRQKHAIDPLRRLAQLMLPLIVLWMVIGTVVYRTLEKWEWVEAIFFAINVGLGVGYGFPRLMTDAGKWYTMFHCAIGTSFVAGILVLGFAEFLRTQKRVCRSREDENFIANLRYHLVKREKRLTLLFMCIVYVGVGVCFAIMPGNLAQGTASGAEMAVESGLAASVASSATADNAPPSMTDAFLFVVTSMATGAQIAPRDEKYPMIFTTVYIIFGIPLWAGTAGMLGGIVFGHYQRRHHRREVALAPVTADSMRAMQQLEAERLRYQKSIADTAVAADTAGKKQRAPCAVDYGSYLELELQRLGLLEPKLLRALRHKYADADWSVTSLVAKAEGACEDEMRALIVHKETSGPKAQYGSAGAQ